MKPVEEHKLVAMEELVSKERQVRIKNSSRFAGAAVVALFTTIFAYQELDKKCPEQILSRQCLAKILHGSTVSSLPIVHSR